MTGSQQPSDVRFVVQRGDSSVDADLELIHGLTSQDIIDAVADARSGTYGTVLPTAGSFTYNADGTVRTDPDGNTYTYNADGSVHTIAKAGVTRTLTYNADGTVASVA